MTPSEPYELVLTPPAVRAIQRHLPETVAAAVIEFLTGALVDNPQRVGKPLRGDLAGIYSARRGTYRVLYRINDDHGRSSCFASTIDETSTAVPERPPIASGDLLAARSRPNAPTTRAVSEPCSRFDT